MAPNLPLETAPPRVAPTNSKKDPPSDSGRILVNIRNSAEQLVIESSIATTQQRPKKETNKQQWLLKPDLKETPRGGC